MSIVISSLRTQRFIFHFTSRGLVNISKASVTTSSGTSSFRWSWRAQKFPFHFNTRGLGNISRAFCIHFSRYCYSLMIMEGATISFPLHFTSRGLVNISQASGATVSPAHGKRNNFSSTSLLVDFDSNRTTRQSIGSDKGPSSKRRGLRESYSKQGFIFCSLLKEHCYDFSSLQGTYKGSTSC